MFDFVKTPCTSEYKYTCKKTLSLKSTACLFRQIETQVSWCMFGLINCLTTPPPPPIVKMLYKPASRFTECDKSFGDIITPFITIVLIKNTCLYFTIVRIQNKSSLKYYNVMAQGWNIFILASKNFAIIFSKKKYYLNINSNFLSVTLIKKKIIQ